AIDRLAFSLSARWTPLDHYRDRPLDRQWRPIGRSNAANNSLEKPIATPDRLPERSTAEVCRRIPTRGRAAAEGDHRIRVNHFLNCRITTLHERSVIASERW